MSLDGLNLAMAAGVVGSVFFQLALLSGAWGIGIAPEVGNQEYLSRSYLWTRKSRGGCFHRPSEYGNEPLECGVS